MCDSGDSHIIMQMNIMLLQKLQMIYAKACKSYLDLQIHWRSLPGSNSSGIEVPNRYDIWLAFHTEYCLGSLALATANLVLAPVVACCFLR